MPITETDLILTKRGAIYHLNLRPEDLANTIILVGDPDRVKQVSSHFDRIELKIQNREFITQTGFIGKKRISVISTGIGTDNIDIVMNELDALVNIDLKNRKEKKEKKSLDIIRIGTCGSLQKNIPVDSFVVSQYGLGLDGLLYYYNSASVIEQKLVDTFVKHAKWSKLLPHPYAIKGSDKLIKKIGKNFHNGITLTAPGFYAPQGRKLRMETSMKNFPLNLGDFIYQGVRIVNFEMETSAIYGLGSLMGHNICTVCSVVANRVTQQFSRNYQKAVNRLITSVLERLTS